MQQEAYLETEFGGHLIALQKESTGISVCGIRSAHSQSSKGIAELRLSLFTLFCFPLRQGPGFCLASSSLVLKVDSDLTAG